jgi:hypothetical protein
MTVGAGSNGFERMEWMRLFDVIRKAFSFLLMSFGVSAPPQKRARKPAPKPETGK